MISSDPNPLRGNGAGAGATSAQFELDDLGWASGVRRLCSPNRDARPPGCAIELIVIHNISLPPGHFGGDAVEALFLNRLDCSAHPYFEQLVRLRVSSHFFIRRDASVCQMVACGERAWHAGVSQWRGRSHCNDFSVGIELEGADDVPYTDAQYESLNGLVLQLRVRYPIADVVGHSDIAPDRKTDPGPAFDWLRLRRATNS